MPKNGPPMHCDSWWRFGCSDGFFYGRLGRFRAENAINQAKGAAKGQPVSWEKKSILKWTGNTWRVVFCFSNMTPPPRFLDGFWLSRLAFYRCLLRWRFSTGAACPESFHVPKGWGGQRRTFFRLVENLQRSLGTRLSHEKRKRLFVFKMRQLLWLFSYNRPFTAKPTKSSWHILTASSVQRRFCHLPKSKPTNSSTSLFRLTDSAHKERADLLRRRFQWSGLRMHGIHRIQPS